MTITSETVKVYSAICDRCGNSIENVSSEERLKKFVQKNLGWHLDVDGRDLCEDCYGEVEQERKLESEAASADWE